MALRLRLLVGGIALGGLAACASIVGLDSSDGEIDATTPAPAADAGSGAPVGEGELTTDAGITISPTNIEFQRSVCGTQQSIKINIKNGTATPTPYSLTIPPSDVFALEGADATGTVKGELAPRDVASVVLKATSSKPGRASADISVVAGTEQTSLNVSLETLGAGLVFTPPALEFGTIREKQDSAETTLTLRNDGNDPITITSFANAPDFATPKEITLQAGATLTQPFKMLAGNAGDPLSQQAVPVTKGEHCGPLPALTLTGQRVSTNVTVSPGQLELGSPSCNGAAGPKLPITLTNYSPVGAASFTVKPPPSSRFDYSKLSGEIPVAPSATQAGTTTIEVGIANVGNTPQDVNETVTITTVGAETKDWPVKLHFKVVGAIVKLDRSSISLGNNRYADVPIENTGNATVCVDYTSDNSQVWIYEGNNDHSDRLNPGDRSQRLSVAFVNGSSTDNSGRVTIKPYACPGTSTIPAVCSPLPTLDVNGNP